MVSKIKDFEKKQKQKLTDLKVEICSLENMANRNGLSVKGLELLHQKRLEFKELMDKKLREGN